jgi:hypothetical protein
MKSRLCRTPPFKQLRYGYDRLYSHCAVKLNNFTVVKGCMDRQHQVLLGIGIFLLLCWIIASIWLINRQRAEQGKGEILEYPSTIAMLSPAKEATKRDIVSGVFTMTDRLVAGGV